MTEKDKLLTIPNLLTLARILLIIPFVYAVTSGNDLRAVIIFFIAGISDALDGTLARALNQLSKFGRLVDPVADKVLAAIAYTAMSFFRGARPAVPAWVTTAVIGRDVLILLGVAIIYRRVRTTDFRPTLAGKLNTVIELNTIGLFLIAQLWPLLAVIFPGLYLLLVLSIVVSFSGYVRQAMKMLTT